MSTQMKLIIPLLDKSIKKEYLSQRAGFVNAFTWDKNKPYIDNCIFLMYERTSKDPLSQERAFVFSGLASLYKMYCIRVKGKVYIIYAISIINKDIHNFLQGFRHSDHNTFIRILQFWDGSDINVLKYLNKSLLDYACSGESVPEEDYNPGPVRCIRTKIPKAQK